MHRRFYLTAAKFVARVGSISGGLRLAKSAVNQLRNSAASDIRKVVQYIDLYSPI